VSAQAAPGAGAGKLPVLYQIEISHFNEKARWALDYKQVPHRRKAPPPMMHMAWAGWLTRGRQKTFPILILDGKAVGDSTAIIAALEERHPDPPLYPADPAERDRALALEEFFDEELGPQLRRVVFHAVTRDSAAFAEAAAPTGGRAVQLGFRASAPVAAPLLRMRYGINDESTDAGRDKILAALDRVEAELSPSGYLVGDGFSVADLTAAALLFPLVRPPEFPYPPSRPLPAEFADFAGSLAARPACEWVREMYRRHRGTSAAVG
jgi:glutathione S-transferase